LIVEVAPAVAQAAMDSGVATRPIKDFDAYRAKLTQYVYRSGLVMKPVFDRARKAPQRIAYADGEDEKVLRAVQIVLDDALAKPILIGRRYVVEKRIEKLGLRFKLDEDVELVDPQGDPRYRDYWTEYHSIMGRRGISPDAARTIVRTRASVIGALMVRLNDADATICGAAGRYERHFKNVRDVIGLREGVRRAYAVQLLILPTGTVFIADTNVNYDPTAEQVAEAAMLAAEAVAQFGLKPKVALVSHSNFGSSNSDSARKMRSALSIIKERAPTLEVEGEMNANEALSEAARERVFPDSELTGAANLLIMPSLDAANIAFDLLRSMAQGLSVGPMLVGLAAPAHVVTPSITVRGLVNMSALAVVEAQFHDDRREAAAD
jgi:malate dehydrogenase (oxaloacetate-decarboxylating)(NADP+)